MTDKRHDETLEALVKKKPKSSNEKKSAIKNFTNKNAIFFLNNDEQDDLSEENICLFRNCKFKSIKDFEFCYQHINAVNKLSKTCCWTDRNGEKCNQLAIPETMSFNTNGNMQNHHKVQEKSYCFQHDAFIQIKKTNENSTSIENDSSKKSHKLIQSPAFETWSVKVSNGPNGEMSSERYLDIEANKNILSEQKFLLISSNEKNERRLFNRKKILKERKNFNATKEENKKKPKLAIDVETHSNDNESSDESSSMHECVDEENYMLKNDSDLENDIELLDPSDSLDQTMFNLIKAKKLNDLNKLDSKKLSLKRNSETNELLLVDYGDFNQEDQDVEHLSDEQEMGSDNLSSATMGAIKAPIVPKNKAINKIIDKNVEYDYDHLLSNAGTYTKEEVIKVFKCKLSKLQLLYKKQLSIVNDRLIYDRKKYLIKKEAEKNEALVTGKSLHTETIHSNDVDLHKALKNYQPLSTKELYLKQKYDPKLFNSPHSIYNDGSKALNKMANKCMFTPVGTSQKQPLNLNSQIDRCNMSTLPLSKYCKEHIIYEPTQILFGVCGENSTSNQMTCKTPVIASIRSKCLMHLSNTSGLLTTNEIGNMNKLDEAAFDSILNKPQQQPVKHLNKLSQAYKQLVNQMIQHEQRYQQQQHNIVEERQEKYKSTFLEDEHSPLGSEDVFEPAEMSSLIHIKQEILEHAQSEPTTLLFDENSKASEIEDEQSKKSPIKETLTHTTSNKLNFPSLESTLEKSKLESNNNSDDDSNSSDSSSTSSTSSSTSSSSTSASSTNSSNSNSSDADTSSNESDTGSESDSSTSSTSDTETKSKSTLDLNENKNLETIVENDEKNSSPNPNTQDTTSQSEELVKINDENTNNKASD